MAEVYRAIIALVIAGANTLFYQLETLSREDCICTIPEAG